MYDFCIIGGGVIGCAVARELSRYKATVVLVEAESDVCARTSGANSGIIHAGYDAPDGSLMSQYNILGAKMFRAYAKVLDVPYKNTGSLVVSLSSDEDKQISALYERGLRLGVAMSILPRGRVLTLEPNLTDRVRSALYASDAAIINPFELVFALKENAAQNGVDFKFNFEVKKIKREAGGVTLTSGEEAVSAKTVINCAGNAGGKIARMFGDPIYLSHRAGEYMYFDKTPFVSRPVFRVPGKKGKGVLVCPTTSGNFFIGPTSVDMQTPSTAVRRQAFAELKEAAAQSVNNIPWGSMITSCSGVRAMSKTGDFIIGKSASCEFLYNIIGICSPGLSAAPAIAVKVAGGFGLKRRDDFVPSRRAIRKIEDADKCEKIGLIESDKAYGNIVCRCETVSEAEVVEAIRRGAVTVDGVKRRLRVGMGRCQGGFCLPQILKILARELGLREEEVLKNSAGSEILIGEDL